MSVTEFRRRLQARRALPPPQMRRAVRRAAGATITEVAGAVGVSRQAVMHWEAGDRTPTGVNLERYLEVLRLMQGDGDVA